MHTRPLLTLDLSSSDLDPSNLDRLAKIARPPGEVLVFSLKTIAIVVFWLIVWIRDSVRIYISSIRTGITIFVFHLIFLLGSYKGLWHLWLTAYSRKISVFARRLWSLLDRVQLERDLMNMLYKEPLIGPKRFFPVWAPNMKTGCNNKSTQTCQCFPAYFQEPHLKSRVLLKMSRVTLQLCYPLIPANILIPRQNGRHFPDDIFKHIFFMNFDLNFTEFCFQGSINNIPALV